MSRVKQRSGIRHFEYRLRKIEQRTSLPSNIVPRRIEKSGWLCGMIAQSRRPALGYRVRATEQAGVCTDARETTRTREIYESQRRRDFQIGKVTLVECSSGHSADCSRLAECFDEGTVHIQPNVQYPEVCIRRVKPVPARLAEKTGASFRQWIREKALPGVSSESKGDRSARSRGGSGCSPGKSVKQHLAHRNSLRPQELAPISPIEAGRADCSRRGDRSH